MTDKEKAPAAGTGRGGRVQADDLRLNYTPESDSAYRAYFACIISKLITGDSVNGHVKHLPQPWDHLAKAIQDESENSGLRSRVFEAALAGLADADSIRAAVNNADPLADLESLLPPVDLTRLPATDAGNSEALAGLYGNRLRYDHRRKRWLIWHGHRWEPDQDGEPERLALDTVRKRLRAALDMKDDEKRSRLAKWALGSENRSRINALIAGAQAMHPITQSGDGWDSAHLLLGCANGVVELESGSLRPGKPADMLTLSTGTEYQPDAQAPRFKRFLSEVFNGDDELIEFIQRAVGYSLTGDIREHKLFLCWGKGANGKGTLFNAIRAALGEYAANTTFSTFEMNQASSNQTNDIAALYGMRFVTASETSESRRMNEARVKAITGGDPVTCRFLFGEYFTYSPTFKVWLAMNHKPTITGTDDGIWRRIRLIPFTVSFKGREDMTLAQDLEAEREGILAWAVQGAVKWLAGGLTEPAAVLAATETYRQESDMLAQFLADCTIMQAGARVKSSTLYQVYLEWCKDNGEKFLTGTTFGRRMKERDIDSVRQSGYVWYLDIGIITEQTPSG